jgi:hypothetical protein
VPRPVRGIEIYLPLDYNDGRAIPESKYVRLQVELLKRFGGVTSTQRQFPLQGLWQAADQVYQDRVVVFGVMDFRAVPSVQVVRYLERLKSRLKRRFAQLEILITVQELLAI